MKSIVVSPLVGEFSDIEPGMIFVVPFTVHNVSNTIKRVRCIPPKTPFFRLVNSQQSIAPGMKQIVEVEFSSKIPQEVHDVLVIRSDEGDITVPLHAWFPAPKFVFQNTLDYGKVSTHHPLEPKKLRVRNTGKKDGVFKFVNESGISGISLSPSCGILQAEQEMEVSVNFFSSEVGMMRAVIRLCIEGQAQPQFLSILADVVESRIALLEPKTRHTISRLTFGKLFFGETQTRDFIIHNFGEHTVSFTVQAPESDPTDPLSWPMACEPCEGRIGGREDFPMKVTFKPVLAPQKKGWGHASVDVEQSIKSWDILYNVEVVETEQRTEFQLAGTAAPLVVDVSERLIQFGTCEVNNHVSAVTTLTNKSSDTAVRFSVSRVAHFSCDPSQGVVPPLGQQNVVVMFHPKQLGTFDVRPNLSFNDAVHVVALSFYGAATSIGPKPPTIGGVDKICEDFVRATKFVRPASSPQPDKASQLESPRCDSPELLLMSEWQQKQQHSKLYNNYVKNCRKVREYQKSNLEQGITQATPDDIGMMPGEGLNAPEPLVPKRVDRLPWAAESEVEKGGDATRSMKKIKVDETKLVKKKFRKEPATLNEMRECKLSLSPKDLQSIIVPVKLIDFGQVRVYSMNARPFFVHNGLKTHILVSVPVTREELSMSTPSAQVVPPGQTAGFDIIFRPHQPQIFQQAIYFTINEVHKLKFIIFAESLPIETLLSHHELQFRFPEVGHEPSVTLPLTMTNPGNSESAFAWSLPSEAGAFVFDPISGKIEPHSAVIVKVTYTPSSTNESKAEATLKVEGASETKKVLLLGSVPLATCTWSIKESKVDFKKVPIGSTKYQTITLKNTGTTSTVFAFDPLLPEGTTLSCCRGRINAQASQDVVVTLRPTFPQSLKAALTCHVRGMKSLLKAQFTAEVKLPDFLISEPHAAATGDSVLDFGGVYVGSYELRRIVIQSHDDVFTFLLVDLSSFPFFSLYDSDKKRVVVVVTESDRKEESGICVIKAQLNDDGLSDDSATDVDGCGSLYRIVIGPHETMIFFLAFTPDVVGVADNFVLPISLAGTNATSEALRPIIVTAEGRKPRLVITPTSVDFGPRVVVRDGTSKVPNRILIRLSNESTEELSWDLEPQVDASIGLEAFRVEPTSGNLPPGQGSQLQLTFTPGEVKAYTCQYSVFLNGDREHRYMDISGKGFGTYPCLTFDRKEVVLPPVPLAIGAKTTFYIGNEGYESLDLKYKIAGEGKLPVTLSFPEGQTITSTISLLPVEVGFSSSKPISFTVSIDFFDDADGIFSLPITCTTDNSLLSCYPYIKFKEGQSSIAAEGDRKPINFKEMEQSNSKERDSLGVPQDEAGNLTYQLLDQVYKKSLSKRSMERLRNWLNINVFPDPVEDLIVSLQGKLLFDFIEILFGKPPPIGVKGKELLIPTEKFDAVLLFLKHYGACLSDVRSEFLLTFEDYVKIVPAEQSVPLTARSSSSAKLKGSPRKVSEKKFLIRSMHAWTTLIHQILKIFYFSRITWKAFKSLPQSTPMQLCSVAEKWASSADPSITESNIYSSSEAILLKWLSLHFAAFFKSDSKVKKGDDSCRVVDFESGLRDCRAYAACVMAFIPMLVPKLESGKDGGILNATTPGELEKNATLLLAGLKDYGMDIKVTPREFLDFSGRDHLLLSAYLYNTLPQYAPKTTIKFKGKILENITKQIELSNPTKFPIVYQVSIDGNDEFKLLDTSLCLEAKGTANFAISVTPRFAKKIESRVVFLSTRGSINGGTMVFALETDVDPDSSIKTLDAIETPIYEPLNVEVVVDNPFNGSGLFTVQILQDIVKDTAQKVYSEEQSSALFPEAFWTSTDTLNIKKNDKGKLSLQFLPCQRGCFRCRLVFRDEKLGEFTYRVNGTGTPPKPFEIVQLQTEASQPITRELTLPLRHVALDRALQQKVERFKQFKGGKKTVAKDSDADIKDVLYRVEFLNDKFVGPNPFFTGPKTLLLSKHVDEEDATKRPQKREKGPQGQVLQFTFSPKGPGSYPCVVLLSSAVDVRVAIIEGKSRAPGMKAELEFNCPARQQISQDIPITNSSEKEWIVSAQLQGEYFAGPREVRVGPGKTKNFALVFNPPTVCKISGTLVLKNSDTQERYTFTLKGCGEEPLAENTIPVECRARESRKITVNVPNITFDDVMYTVETDIPFASGDPHLIVTKMEVGTYTLNLKPQVSGKTTGSITFIAPNKQFVWFVVQCNVLRPLAQDTITVQAEVRKGAVAEIGINNPTDKPVDFTVHYKGDGLFGETILALLPNQQNAVYQLAFAPSNSGDFDGVISFNNDDVGEFWYKLALKAKPADPMVLNFQSELGRSSVTEVLVENPLDVECTMTVSNTNDTNFTVTPQVLVMRANATIKANLTFIPSSLHGTQESFITISHPKAGVWEYRCKGTGMPPTKMETVTCVSQIHRTSTVSVMFRNPFPVPKKFVPSLAGDKAFSLVQKRQPASLGPFQALQIAVAYTPYEISEHRGAVIVDSAEKDSLKWEFPILGVAESSSTAGATKFSCRSRSSITQKCTFVLSDASTAVSDIDLSWDISIPMDVKHFKAASNSLVVEKASSSDSSITFDIIFSPLRPFAVLADLLLKRQGGGLWRFPLSLDATPPSPDDTIVLEAAVNVVATASFQLYNVLPTEKPFVAYFSNDSPQEFSVQPTKGLLPAMPTIASPRAAGVTFVVSFSSSTYGKSMIGQLVVDTEEMQWRYDVHGTLPKYVPPTNIPSKVVTRR